MAVNARLKHDLGDLEVTLATASLRCRWLALPFEGVQRLLASGNTRVAYESTVVTAATLWLQVQPEHAVSIKQQKHLAGCVRLTHLPTTYLATVLPGVSWFRAVVPVEDLQAATALAPHYPLLRSASNYPDPLISKRLSAWPCWFVGMRRRSSLKRASVALTVEPDELQAMFEAAQRGEDAVPLKSEDVEWAGYAWRLELQLEDDLQVKFEGLCKEPDGRAATGWTISVVLMVRFVSDSKHSVVLLKQVSIQSSIQGQLVNQESSGMVLQDCFGWADFLRTGAISCWPRRFRQDPWTLTATISSLD